jgi:hypothetical protein
MKIDRIYVAGYRHDVQFTRTCVASIRHWYPEARITLIKDRFYGDYNTRDIEKYFHCDILAAGESRFGWGFGKLEPLFLREPQRFLVLDSDIVFAGPVLTRLEKFAEDFVVEREDPSPAFVRKNYFDLDKLATLDPNFQFPGFTFNTGQWVGTSGRLTREDFAPWLKPGTPPQLLHSDVFQLGEQGLLNYLLMKLAATGRITLARDRFMEVGSDPAVAEIKLANLTTARAYDFLIHWCGLRKPDFAAMVRGDILEFFEKEFYSRLPLGSLRRRWRYASQDISTRGRAAVRRLWPRRAP